MGLLDAFGGNAGNRGFGMSPLTMALAGLVAYRTYKGKGRLADMLGTSATSGGAAGTAPAPGGAPMGGLGALLSGGGLSAGLKDLLDRFKQAGHENTAQSWVSPGPNQPIAPHDMEQVLGEERLQWLMEQTGMPKDKLLDGLSSALPETINKLTPNGRIPTDEELKANP
jgi:uncharacterized protein YidB (DUF937 family)